MAGASKRRAAKEQKTSGSSEERSSAQDTGPPRSSPQRSSPQSLARFDGNRDPETISYTAPAAGARNPNTAAVIVDPRRLDLGMSGWSTARGFELPQNLPPRPPKLNSQGAEVSIGLNTFSVANFPTKPVYQYDVLIGNGAEKRGLIRKVWGSKAVNDELGKGWLYDGNRIAWSLVQKPKEVRITVDLDREQGRTPRGDRRNVHTVYIKLSNTVKFDALVGYLNRQGPFDNACLEAITFLDHLMREYPSQQFTQIKRSFFARGQQRYSLGGGVEAFKGVYSSMRVILGATGGARLSVNVDVANGTFWTESELMYTAMNVSRQRSVDDLARGFESAKRDWRRSVMYQALKRLHKVEVYATHRGRGTIDRFIIDRFLDKLPSEHWFENVKRNDQGEEISRRMMTVEEYFQETYGITPRRLPLVQMTKKNVVLPMDVCKIVENQRYQFKLDEKQTSAMIKFAVTPPKERWEAIQHGLGMLDWQKDPFLKNYGLQIDPRQTVVKARVLPAPDVTFAPGGKVKKIPAGTASSGRWRIDGTQFLTPNPRPLKAWGVCVIQGRGACDAETTKRFFQNFVRVYKAHGGKFEVTEPVILPGNIAKGGEMITEIWNATGNKHQMKPQILFFVVPDRDSGLYLRIKKSCECRYGVVSQVLQSGHVQKMQDQYISNVCMKVNAKLGGSTSRAVGTTLSKLMSEASKKMPTMCIGADVSHAAPGSEAGSMAAFTMSLDPGYTRYAAQCDTNGHRVEIITTANIDKLLKKLMQHWISTAGRGALPERILYFRDGVSEGQYQHVLDQEVRDIKSLCKELNPKSDVKFVVLVASKRHHVRFFPQGNAGDRNGNPKPGTLVETGVTHPFEFDFYLCSHSAIKGTARPVHYHVLLNEANMGAEELQQLIYEHSYQYARATTPVSLFPAVYYAHLASNRAKAHENPPKVSSGKKETTEKKETGTSTSDKTPTEIPPLMAMNNGQGIDLSMWYI